MCVWVCVYVCMGVCVCVKPHYPFYITKQLQLSIAHPVYKVHIDIFDLKRHQQ